MSSVGSGGRSSGINEGTLFLQLKDRSKRKLDADAVAREITAKASAVPGVQVYLTNPPVINIGGRRTRSLYQFTLQGTDINELFQKAGEFEVAGSEDSPGITDVNSDLQIKNPQVQVTIDRDRAAQLGISAEAVQEALYNAYGARAGLHHLHSGRPVLGGDGAVARVPAGSRRAESALDPVTAMETWFRSLPSRKVEPDVGPADRQSPGPAAGGDHLLQHRSRGLPGRRGVQGAGSRAIARCPPRSVPCSPAPPRRSRRPRAGS